MKYYAYQLHENRLAPLKLVLLAVLLLAHIVNVIYFFGAVWADRMWIVYTVVIGIVLVLLQISVTFLTHSYDYVLYDNILQIARRYPLSRGKQYRIDVMQIVSVTNMSVDSDLGQSLRLCPNACSYPRYMVQLSDGQSYLLALDDYMYAQCSQALRKENE